MPRKTIKSKIIDRIYFDACIELLNIETSDESEADEIEDTLMMNVLTVEQFRYGDINAVPKQSIWLSEVLPSYDEGRFKEVTRLNYGQFNKVYLIIKDNKVFGAGCGYAKQTPVSIQLAIALYRFGTYGNGSSVKSISKLFGVGDGSTITRITRRVIKAIRDVEHRFLYWPDEQERSEGIVPATFDYLPRCIGWIDGVHIPLDEAPHLDREAYYSKDKEYSIQAQLVCDHKKMIRHYVVGYPGSCHDSRVWNESKLSLNSTDFFSNDQWIGGDKGYPLRSNIITPMKASYKKVEEKDKKKFNKYFSSYRVKIEHVNGALKETFESLKKLRVRILDKKGHQKAVEWIQCCLILYNIVQPFDNWTPSDVDRDDDDKSIDGDILDDDFSAEHKRLALFNFVIDQ